MGPCILILPRDRVGRRRPGVSESHICPLYVRLYDLFRDEGFKLSATWACPCVVGTSSHITRSLTQSLPPSITHSLPPFVAHCLLFSLIPFFSHLFPLFLTHSVLFSLTPFFSHSLLSFLTPFFLHSFPPFLTHSQSARVVWMEEQSEFFTSWRSQ